MMARQFDLTGMLWVVKDNVYCAREGIESVHPKQMFNNLSMQQSVDPTTIPLLYPLYDTGGGWNRSLGWCFIVEALMAGIPIDHLGGLIVDAGFDSEDCKDFCRYTGIEFYNDEEAGKWMMTIDDCNGYGNSCYEALVHLMDAKGVQPGDYTAACCIFDVLELDYFGRSIDDVDMDPDIIDSDDNVIPFTGGNLFPPTTEEFAHGVCASCGAPGLINSVDLCDGCDTQIKEWTEGVGYNY